MSDMSGFLAAPYYYSYKRDAYSARCGATVPTKCDTKHSRSQVAILQSLIHAIVEPLGN